MRQVDCTKCPWELSGRSVVKCCTFRPLLPNYKLGEFLYQDPSLFETQIIPAKSDYICSPIGMFPKRNYRQQLLDKPEEFGRNSALVCNFYNKEQGSCNIWQYRGSECRQFSCQTIEPSFQAFDLEMLDIQMVLIYKGESLTQIKNYLDIYNLERRNSEVELEEARDYYRDCYRIYKEHKQDWQNQNEKSNSNFIR